MQALNFTAPRFGNNHPPVETYARPTDGNGNGHLRMMQTQPSGVPFPWLFAHRERGKGAVHALTIVENEKGEQFVHLLVTKRPPLGGKLAIETPAGLWGDNDDAESVLTAANREVREETGYRVEKSKLLTPGMLATSPGMTTEHKAIALTLAKGEPGETDYDAAEGAIIVDKINVPLETFANYDKFMTWLKEQQDQDMTVCMSVVAARGLLPPTTGGRLNIEG